MKSLRIEEIRNAPTVVDHVHQSVYRSTIVLSVVREMLEAGAPAAVVLAFIADCEGIRQRADELACAPGEAHHDEP